MLTITYSGSGTAAGLKVYKNGSLFTTTPFADTLGTQNINTGGAVTFEICAIFGANQWNGSMDELGIWNKELTTTEITALYNSGAGLTY